ncbi:MAG: hypothetical protein M3460_23535 [Actinomycetota bacterium]|nr:hypothetical protein [Actinomycetota bacterium]
MTEELRRAGRAAEIAPVFIEAGCELGYVVTEDTRHLFSVGEIAAWEEAVRRHAGDLDEEIHSDDEVSNKNVPYPTYLDRSAVD